MAGLDDIINLTITTSTVSPTRQGFGTPLLMAYHAVTVNLVEEYSSTADMVSAGFATTSPAYRMAQAVFSQNPRPPKIILGKRTSAYTQILEIVPLNLTAGFKYQFEIVSALGVVTAINYTVLAGATTNSVCVALQALIDPVDNAAAVVSPAAPNATKIVVTSTAGNLTNFRKLPKITDMSIKDVSVDPGIAADLSAVESFVSESISSASWYAIAFDHSPKAVIEAAAAWIETRNKITVCNTSDSECLDNAVTTDVASVLKLASRMRTELLFSGNEILSYSAAAWLGRMLPTDPGSATWAFKNLIGITADNLTAGQKSTANGKNLNTFVRLGGKNITQWGENPDGGFTDIIVGRDWLYARIQETLFAALTEQDKIPYTDSGVDAIASLILAILKKGIEMGFLAADPEPTVSFPKVADIDAAEKTARNLPNGKFFGTLAGAIHTLDIDGTLTV